MSEHILHRHRQSPTGLTSWTDERVEYLKTAWADGQSCSQIAHDMGGLTRNAVIGKVHRLGLDTHRENIKPRVTFSGPPNDRRIVKLPAPVIPSAPLEPQLVNGAFYTIETIPFRGRCKWISQIDHLDTAPLCGRGCEGSWCDIHRAKLHAPSRPLPSAPVEAA